MSLILEGDNINSNPILKIGHAPHHISAVKTTVRPTKNLMVNQEDDPSHALSVIKHLQPLRS